MSSYVCVGTKRISIDEEEDCVGDGDAIISLFRLRPIKSTRSSSTSTAEGRDWRSPSPRESFDGDSTVDDCLHLMATDGEYTYYKRYELMFYQHSNNININIVAYASANLDAQQPLFYPQYRSKGYQAHVPN